MKRLDPKRQRRNENRTTSGERELTLLTAVSRPPVTTQLGVLVILFGPRAPVKEAPERILQSERGVSVSR